MRAFRHPALVLCAFLPVILLQARPAAAHGFWTGRFPVPLQEYLDRPFDPDDICLYLASDPLTAADLHLRGSPKELTESFILYNDDGTIENKVRSVVQFSRTGQTQNAVDTIDGNEIISKVIFRYDDFKRLSEIDSADPKLQSNCLSRFSYDLASHLVKIIVTSSDGTNGTIDITYGQNGRLKESVSRRSTGKAEWRLAYSYGNRSVTIERYFSNDLSEGNEKSTFQLDPSNRPWKINNSSHDSSFGDEIGTYIYTYLPSGQSLMHIELSRADKPCILDFSLHRDGEVDLNSIKVLGDRSLTCNAPNGSDGIIQTYFDPHGNKVVDSEGNEIQELGRSVVRWKSVTMNAISYY